MDGFDFFCHSEVSRLYGDKERDRISQELKREEAGFFRPLKGALIGSAAGLGMLLERHANCDLAFITAFLTGTNEDELDTTPGWGRMYYRDGEVDSFGTVHKGGEKISNKENEQRNTNLEVLLTGIGYHFVRVLGHYDTEEHSYCVMNYAEDTARFIDDMEGAAALWNQDSVLIVPRASYGKGDKRGMPFLYYPSENKVRYALGENPEQAVKKYYTLIGKDHISYSFDFKSELVPIDSGLDFSNGLSPIRRGYPGAWVADNRHRLRHFWDVQSALRANAEATRRVLRDEQNSEILRAKRNMAYLSKLMG